MAMAKEKDAVTTGRRSAAGLATYTTWRTFALALACSHAAASRRVDRCPPIVSRRNDTTPAGAEAATLCSQIPLLPGVVLLLAKACSDSVTRDKQDAPQH